MIILKTGGGREINWDYISSDVKKLVESGEQLVIVHGASTKRDEIAKQLQYPTQTITSPSGITSVYTDETAIDMFLMVYAGLTNKRIVTSLQRQGVNAVGLSGVDGRLWSGKRKKAVYAQNGDKTKLITDSMTGKIERINTQLINLLLDHQYVPVLCPPALSEENDIINTDNDWATGVLAGELGVEELVVLFEAPGMLKTFGDESTLIKNINKHELHTFLSRAEGRMKKKILGAEEAFKRGLKKMYWSDGRISNPISKALQGVGTIIS